jgi:hypothetical protein
MAHPEITLRIMLSRPRVISPLARACLPITLSSAVVVADLPVVVVPVDS